MRHYISKRILLFIPTLLIITLLAFAISVNAPGDPIERLVGSAQEGNEGGNLAANSGLQKKIWREKLGLNLPLFYIELSDLASPDTLYKITDASEREALKRLLFESGNWNTVAQYSKCIQKTSYLLQTFHVDSALLPSNSNQEIRTAVTEVQAALSILRSSYTKRSIAFQFQVIEANLSFLKASAVLSSGFYELKQAYAAMQENQSKWKNYIPYLHFHASNQYHNWLFGDGNWLSGEGSKFSKGIIRGDFGTSYASKEAVSKKIVKHLLVSLFFALLSVILAYLISIAIASKAALHPHSKFDKASSLLLFSLYSLPSFFLATLLLLVFANPDMLQCFPTSGLEPASGMPTDAGILERLGIRLQYIILPLICYTYSSLAFLSRSMRSALLENLSQDYIRTARAKGLSEQSVIYKHALKNALIPFITLFASVFPYAIGGSVILETIFTIPGMGLETFMAIKNQDYPVIVAVFTLTGCMTLSGALIADILYAFADPRISFSKTQ